MSTRIPKMKDSRAVGPKQGGSVRRLKAMTRWIGAGLLALALVTSASAHSGFAQGNRFQRNPGRQQNQGHHAGQWLKQHRNMPPEQQRRALESDPGFRGLPPQRQQQLRNQLQRFNSMRPEQQDRMLNRMETWEHLTPQQKEQARGLYQRYQQLPEEPPPGPAEFFAVLACHAARGPPTGHRLRGLQEAIHSRRA